jgi:hypothetical protein
MQGFVKFDLTGNLCCRWCGFLNLKICVIKQIKLTTKKIAITFSHMSIYIYIYKPYLWPDRFQSLKHLKNRSCSMKQGKKFSSMMQEFLVLNNDEITEWFPLNNTLLIWQVFTTTSLSISRTSADNHVLYAQYNPHLQFLHESP